MRREAYIHEIISEDRSMSIKFSGCNFRCKGCENPNLQEFITEEQEDLLEVKKLMKEQNPEEVVFSGGEPLLQPSALKELLSFAKSQGFKTVLVTNGSKPTVLSELLRQGLVDEVVLKLKADRKLFPKVTRCGSFFVRADDEFWAVVEALRTISEYQDKVRVLIKTVIIPGLLYKKEDLELLADLIIDNGLSSAEWLLSPMIITPENNDKGLRGLEPPTARFLELLAEHLSKKKGLRVGIELKESLLNQ